MKKAVIITGPGFEDVEVVYPYYRLIEEGLQVDIATKDGKEVQSKHSVSLKALFLAEPIDARKLNEKDYQLVVIPGGYEAPDRVRQIKEVLVFIKEMNKKNKIIASICHGPWVLISAGIVAGKKTTSYIGCKDDLVNAGAIYFDKSVVIDKNIVTSRHPRDLHIFMKETIRIFNDRNR